LQNFTNNGITFVNILQQYKVENKGYYVFVVLQSKNISIVITQSGVILCKILVCILQNLKGSVADMYCNFSSLQ